MKRQLFTIAFTIAGLKHIEQIMDFNGLYALERVKKKYKNGIDFRVIKNIKTKSISFDYIPIEGLYTDYSKRVLN